MFSVAKRSRCYRQFTALCCGLWRRPFGGDALKKPTGQSTQHRIDCALMERAKDALAAPELSVSEIAYALGFETPQAFSKLYKQEEGCRRWRVTLF